jgi:hypothetical protein
MSGSRIVIALLHVPHPSAFPLPRESAMLIAISTTKDENGLFSKQ